MVSYISQPILSWIFRLGLSLGENNISGKIYAVRLSPDFHDAGIGEKNNIGPANFVLSVRPIPWYLCILCWLLPIFTGLICDGERKNRREKKRKYSSCLSISLLWFQSEEISLVRREGGKKGGQKERFIVITSNEAKKRRRRSRFDCYCAETEEPIFFPSRY